MVCHPVRARLQTRAGCTTRPCRATPSLWRSSVGRPQDRWSGAALRSPSPRHAPPRLHAQAPSTAAVQPAAYIRRPLAAGDVEEHPVSVVVMGDVPAGSRVIAGGDVVVLGRLEGEAAAGCADGRNATVVALHVSAQASISIAGVTTAPKDGACVMAVLEPGATEVTFKALPGTTTLAVPSPAAAEPSVSLRQLGNLGVLALGAGLAVAPAAILGGLLHAGADTAPAALLECFVYGFILLQGANLLGDGSELLLEILNPGVVGGVLLPVLGAMPDSLIVLNSGLNSTPEQAAEEIAVGIGTLAGSSILLLSLAWGGSVLLGRCDLDDQGVAQDRTLTRGWDLSETGVTVDGDVRKGAAVMAASALLYGTVQVPAFLGDSQDPQAALIGAGACIGACLAYCLYSVVSPELQKRRIDNARKARFRNLAVRALALKTDTAAYGGLVDENGSLNASAVDCLFDEFDTDKSGTIDERELQGLLVGLQLSGSGGSATAADAVAVEYLSKEFDGDRDARVTRSEFRAVLGKWVAEKLAAPARTGIGAPGSALSSVVGRQRAQALLTADLPPAELEALRAMAAELEQQSREEAAEDLEEGVDADSALSKGGIALRASLTMGAGLALCAIFSDPLVEALTNLSRATGVSPFVTGFVLTPLASNASEVLSSLRFASKRRRKNMSLTMAQIYGAVTMNNTLVLGLFLLVVHLQQLQWVYSSEVTVIVGVSAVVGALGYSRSTFTSGLALPVMALYPLSLVAVELLDKYLGWQ